VPVVADVSECCRDVLEVQGTLAEVGERPDVRHDAVVVGFASARVREVALGVRRRCVMDVHDGGGEALDPLGDVAVGIVVSGIEQQLEFLRSSSSQRRISSGCSTWAPAWWWTTGLTSVPGVALPISLSRVSNVTSSTTMRGSGKDAKEVRAQVRSDVDAVDRRVDAGPLV